MLISKNVDTNFLLRQNLSTWEHDKPWADSDAGLENTHPITLAQLKFAFSFDLFALDILDSDDDGSGDLVEIQSGNDPKNPASANFYNSRRAQERELKPTHPNCATIVPCL